MFKIKTIPLSLTLLLIHMCVHTADKGTEIFLRNAIKLVSNLERLNISSSEVEQNQTKENSEKCEKQMEEEKEDARFIALKADNIYNKPNASHFSYGLKYSVN